MSSATSAINGVEKTFGEVSNGIQHIQGAMASIIPSFPGVSAGKILDLAIGLDFEPTIMPPCPVFPVPHCGLVFDPFALIMGAIASSMPANPGSLLGKIAAAIVNFLKPTVQANNFWICNAGTSVYHLPAFLIHLIPLAKPFSSSELWMGSSTVLANGGPFSTQFHPTLSCNLVGFPSLPRKNKTPRLKYPLMLPTSILICIFSGNGKILAGGPPTIDLFALAMKMGLKGLGKLSQKGIDKIPAKYSKLADKLQSVQCKTFGEPVDTVTGSVTATNTDFELPGPLPLRWTRYYYSDAEVEGPLGFNWHHSYNRGLYDMGNGYLTLRLADGRETTFPKVHMGEVFYNREEQLFFQQDEKGFFITDAEKQVFRFEGPDNKEGYTMLSSITNTSGYCISFHYDQKGQLKQIIDSRKQAIQVENDELGRITRIYMLKKGRGEINFIQYHYDATGNMVATQDGTGAEKQFYYQDHLLVQLTNQSGMNFYWEYAGRGDDARCIHTWGDEGVLEYWAEYKEGVTITRNSLGYTAEYYYDSRRLIYKIVDENGGITQQSWNKFKELELTVNAEGGIVKYDYNEYGKLVSITNENRQNNNYQYDDRQNLKYVSSFGNNSEFYFYDPQNRLTSRRKQDGRAVHYIYEGAHLKQIKDHRGRTVDFIYNEQNDVIKVVYFNGLEERWQYDALGYITRYTDVRGNSTEYKNDAAGNVLYLKEADGNEHNFTYDTSYNLVEAKDRLHQVQFEYGPLGVLKKRIQNNRTVQFNYDTELQLRSIANEGSELYKFGLDGMGNVVNEWGFDGLHRRYIRDGNGRVTKVLRPAERWTQYSYDGVGNIVQEEHNDGTRAAYKYNTDGLLTEAFNNDSRIELTRTRNGRIIKETQDAYTVTRKYDVDGNCLQIESNLEADIHFEYDRNDLVKKMEATSTVKSQTSNDKWNAVFQRDNTGLELHRHFSGNVEVQTERDRLGRVTRRSIGAQNAEQSRTRYDWGMGNRLNRMVNELSKTSTLFDYDAFDNLVSATYESKSGAAETIYRMPDKIGNLFKTRDRSDRKYSKGGRLQEDDQYVYHYDGEGNIIFKEFKKNPNTAAVAHAAWAKENELDFKRGGTGWIYEWAGNGMLKKVINPGGREIEFYYDPLGRRIAKVVKTNRYPEPAEGSPQNEETVTRWVWDGNVPLHEWKYEGAYPPKKSVDEQGIKEEKEPVENLITWVFEKGSFVPAAKLDADNEYSIVTDYLGTPTHAYNKQGQKVWERELDCYGALRKEDGSKNFIPYLYQGQYVDEDTGLAYNRFRYYDNESGNYISQDPIRLNGGIKLYGYVSNSNYLVDIFGLTGLDDGGHSVYGLFDEGASKPYYIGISNDPTRRELEHLDSGRMTDNTEMRVLHEDLTYKEARGTEQHLIEKHETKTGVIGQDISATNRGNKINSFDKGRTDPRGTAFNKEYKKAKAKDKAGAPNTHH